jgi:Ca2+-binding RTX toxin-like protein
MTSTPTDWSGKVVFEDDPAAFGARIAALDDGTFVISWQTQDDIFGRHFNEQGSFTAGDFLRDISTTSDQLATPIVTQQTNGSVVVNYGDLTGTTPVDRDIFWTSLNSDRDSVSTPFGTETSPQDEILLDSVAHGETSAGDPAGGTLVYKFTEGTATSLVMRFTTTTGVQASNQIFIDPNTDRAEDDAALASLHTGFVAVAYSSFKDTRGGPDDRDIRMKVYSPDGSQVSGDLIVSTSDKFASFPDVTELSDGNFVVAWQQAGGIAFRRYSGNGTALDDTPVVIPDTNGGFTPKITPLNDHGFMVAWTNFNGTESDGSPNLDIFLQRFDASGHEIGETIHLDEEGDQGLLNMNIATLTDGRVVLTYSSETGDATNQTELVYRIFDPREAHILGTSHNDNIVGRLGSSTIEGLDGNDKLTGMTQADKLFGGIGTDALIGQGGDDFLSGGKGGDRLDGGDGADQLRGNLGKDIMAGGAGADVFFFKSAAESTVDVSGRDAILDFKHAEHDQIDLHAIDANSKSGGNQKFDFIGDDHFHHHAGELRVDHSNGSTFVNGDVNGDGRADFSIEVHDSVNLQGGDFVTLRAGDFAL